MSTDQPQPFTPQVGRPHIAAMLRRSLIDRAADVFEVQLMKGIREGESGRHRAEES